MSADLDLLAGLRDGAWLDEQQFPPVSWAVPGLVPEGFSLLVGPPKAGKSYLILGACLGVAAGGYVLGKLPVDKRPVLYMALEDGDRRMQDRCRQLLGSEPIPPGFQYLTRVAPGTTIATVEAWLDLWADEQPLVVVDTLGRVMPPALAGESAYARDYRVGAALKHLVDERPGSSLVVAHHDRKAETGDFVDSVSGTNGLAGSSDTVVVLSRARNERTGILRVTGRDVNEGEYAVTFTASGAWQLDGSALAEAAAKAAQVRAASGLGDRSHDVLEVVNRRPSGTRAADVADELGIDAKQAGTYLGRLADTGRIQRAARGLYTPVGCVGTVGTDVRSHTSHTSTGGLWDEPVQAVG
jgi:hypothetical protein